MRTFGTRFGARMARSTGALELMADLGSAAARMRDGDTVHMLGGGNPARIAAVEAVYRRRLGEIAADDAQFGRFAAGYSAPGGDLGFRQAVAASLRDEFGWPLTADNVGLTSGSQTAFFFLFNLFGGERADGGRSRILLPLAPEYIGYADLGLAPGMLLVAAGADARSSTTASSSTTSTSTACSCRTTSARSACRGRPIPPATC